MEAGRQIEEFLVVASVEGDVALIVGRATAVGPMVPSGIESPLGTALSLSGTTAPAFRLATGDLVWDFEAWIAPVAEAEAALSDKLQRTITLAQLRAAAKEGSDIC